MKKTTATLEIGNDTIKLAIKLQRNQNKNKTNNITILTAESTEFIHKNKILSEAKFTSTIEDLIFATQKELNIEIEKIDLILNHHKLKTEAIMNKKVLKNSLIITDKFLTEYKDRLQQKVNNKITNYICDNFSIVSLVADGEDVTSNPNEISVKKDVDICINFVKFPKNYYKQILDLVETILVVNSVSFAPISMSNLIGSKEKEIGVIAIDIGKSITNIVVWRSGVLLKLFSLEYGVADLIEIVALKEKVSIKDAETLYINNIIDSTSLNPNTITALDKSLKNMFKEILNSLKEVDNHLLFPIGTILSGGGSYYNNTLSIAKSILNLNCNYITNIKVMNYKKPNRVFAGIYGDFLNKPDDKEFSINKIFFKAQGIFKNFFS